MREYMRGRRAGQAAAKSKLPAPKVQVRCLLCGEGWSSDRIMVGADAQHMICEGCVAEAADLIAAERARLIGVGKSGEAATTNKSLARGPP